MCSFYKHNTWIIVSENVTLKQEISIFLKFWWKTQILKKNSLLSVVWWLILFVNLTYLGLRTLNWVFASTVLPWGHVCEAFYWLLTDMESQDCCGWYHQMVYWPGLRENGSRTPSFKQASKQHSTMGSASVSFSRFLPWLLSEMDCNP